MQDTIDVSEVVHCDSGRQSSQSNGVFRLGGMIFLLRREFGLTLELAVVGEACAVVVDDSVCESDGVCTVASDADALGGGSRAPRRPHPESPALVTSSKQSRATNCDCRIMATFNRESRAPL
jgi:hypothetical protein